MHVLKRAGESIAALGDRHDRQSDVPRHRPPHLQRLHEGLHLPEAGAGEHPAGGDRRVLTDVLELPCGVEIYGLLTRWNPLNVQAPVRPAVQRRRTCSSSASGRRATRSRTIWRTRVSASSASTASRSSRCPRSSSASDGRPSATAVREYSELETAARRTHPRRLRRRVGVRHHRALGQELPRRCSYLTLVRRENICAVYGGMRFGGTLDARRRVAARLRPRRDRHRRGQADDHRHEEQPDSRRSARPATS